MAIASCSGVTVRYVPPADLSHVSTVLISLRNQADDPRVIVMCETMRVYLYALGSDDPLLARAVAPAR